MEFRWAGYCVDDEECLAAIGLRKTGRFYAEAGDKPNVIHWLRLGQDPYLAEIVPVDFGKFTRIVGTPRVMQFALRLEF